MANIAASDLTYVVKPVSSNASTGSYGKKYLGSAGYEVRGSISFGNNSLTYGGSGGLALTKGKMGLPRVVRSFRVLGSTTQKYDYEYIPSTEKLMLKILGSYTPTGNVAAPTISLGNAGANVVANATIGLSALANAASLQGSGGPWVGITGVQAPAFTGDANATLSFSELGNVAITTTTIEFVATGY